jgi:predicted HTH transcriptional regulator
MSELSERIAEGEHLTLSFVNQLDDQEKIARLISGMSNTNGGGILIGVKENGKIVGVDPKEGEFLIREIIQTFCSPLISFESMVYTERHHFVLEIKLKKSSQKHKFLTGEGSILYARYKDRTIEANKIQKKIWSYEFEGLETPTALNERAIQLLDLIQKHQPASLSMLYKHSDLKLKDVDSIVAQLVYWQRVKLTVMDSGSFYSIWNN